MTDSGSHATIYRNVFLTLLVLTVVTVAAAKLNITAGLAVSLALLIAAFKSSLVASYFMHLKSEKRIIHLVLLVTFVFFLALIFLPLADTMVSPRQ